MTPRSNVNENPELIRSTIRTAERIANHSADDADNALGDLRAQLRALRARASGLEQPPEWERVVDEADTRLTSADDPSAARDVGRRLAQELRTFL